MIATLYLLVAVGGGHTSPNTLAVFNDMRTCTRAADMLYQQSKDRRGSSYIYGYCIPVPASSVVK